MERADVVVGKYFLYQELGCNDLLCCVNSINESEFRFEAIAVASGTVITFYFFHLTERMVGFEPMTPVEAKEFLLREAHALRTTLGKERARAEKLDSAIKSYECAATKIAT